MPYTTRGELRVGNLCALHLDQRCSLLDDDLSVLGNVRLASPDSESVLRTALARYLFTGDAVHQKVKDLSGGERLRAALARGFLGARGPELLLLDEPTNNLDLTNVAFLEKVVRAFRGAVIVVSHDRHFLANCAIDVTFALPA